MDVRGYSTVDDDSVGVRINPQREYILRLRPSARDLDWTQTIAVRSYTNFVCVGDGIGVEVISGDPERVYQVIQIERAPQSAPEGS